jgi:hypothetical protein
MLKIVEHILKTKTEDLIRPNLSTTTRTLHVLTRSLSQLLLNFRDGAVFAADGEWAPLS